MSERNRIHWQRSFRIPVENLDLFLVKVRKSRNEMSYFECSYIFRNGSSYDVVVEEFGDSYPYVENEIVSFAKELQASQDPPKPKEFDESAARDAAMDALGLNRVDKPLKSTWSNLEVMQRCVDIARWQFERSKK